MKRFEASARRCGIYGTLATDYSGERETGTSGGRCGRRTWR